MTRAIASRTRTETRCKARSSIRAAAWLTQTLCAALLGAALGGCAPDPDDAGWGGPPVEAVAWIESSEGQLWLGAPPPAAMISDDALAEAAKGIVAVHAKGCGPVANGTAFAVAPGLLVGAAHVTGGATSIEIEWHTSGSGDPSIHPVEVVGFSEARDLVLLRTDAGVSPLRIDRARLGATGAVLGYREGSVFEASPARIEHYVRASGLWGSGTTRSVYVLAASVRTGQSGAPLVDQDGSVVGVVFGTVRGPTEIGFALSRAELVGFLVSAGIDARVDYLGRTVIKAQPEELSVIPNGECSS